MIVCPSAMTGMSAGIATHVTNIATRLAQKHDITLFGFNPQCKYPRFEIVDGVKVERFKMYYPGDAYYFSVELPLALRQLDFDFDIVHGHGYHAFPMHLAAMAECKKFIVTNHFHGEGHSAFRSSLLSLLKPFGKRTLTKANSIVAVSQYEKNLLCQQFGLNQEKIQVIPNGLDLKMYTKLRSQRNNTYKKILYVGRLHWYKGVHFLVEALPKLDKDIALEIVGNGPLQDYLKNRAKALGVSDRVKFYHDLPKADLLQKYADANLFVLLSKLESYSIAVAEALAVGTPCLVAETSALIEWVDNKSCFGIKMPIDINCLISTINNILQQTGNKKVTTTWFGQKIIDWDDAVKRLEEVYAK